MSEYSSTSPFPHFRIENLLLPDIYRQLCFVLGCYSKEFPMIVDQDERRMMYAPLMVRSAVEFFCGAYMRVLLSRVLRSRVSRPKGAFPQLRITTGPAIGLPVHSDALAQFSMATFFFSHVEWPARCGGYLRLHSMSQDGDPGPAERAYPPDPNTLVGMLFSKRSFHSVSPICCPRRRVAIYQEWNVG